MNQLTVQLKDSKDNAQDPVFLQNIEKENTTKSQASREKRNLRLQKEKKEKNSNLRPIWVFFYY